VLASALPAQAAGLPRLVVHRTDDTRECPDARALASMVATQMKRPALEPVDDAPPGPERGLDIQIYRSDQGFTAVIQAGGKTRKLSDKGATCTSLAVALALSISVLLDMVVLPPEPPPPPSPSPEPPSPSPSPSRRLLREPVPLPDESPAPDERSSEVRRFHVSLMAAPVVTLGFLQSWAGGVTSEVEFRINRFSVSGGVLVLPGQSFAPPMGGGQVNLELIAGMVRGCATAADKESLRLGVCIETYAGEMEGSGVGFATNQSSVLPWVAAGTSVLFEQRIWGPLSWGARAGLVFPLLKASFSADNMTAFSPAPVAGTWDAELRVSIW
jgi:hypothetical protein